VLVRKTVRRRFEDGRPEIVATPRALFIARDTCWVGKNSENLLRRYLKGCGVINRNAVALVETSQPAPHVDLRMWHGPGKRIPFIIHSGPKLHYDGKTVTVDVTFDASGAVTDALAGEIVPSRGKDFGRVMRMTLKAGEVRVLVAIPNTGAGRGEETSVEPLSEAAQSRAR
jgi:hypothetical protein